MKKLYVCNKYFPGFQNKMEVKGIIFTYINICINQYIRIYCFINKDKC